MIKPSDCLTVMDKKVLIELELKVDDYLRNNYVGQKLNLCGIINIPEGRIRTAIIQMYRKNGWDVWFVPSAVDGLPEGPYFIEQGKKEAEKR